MEEQIVRTFRRTESKRGVNWSHGVLESPGERHICVVVHPIRAEDELVGGLRDTRAESLAGIGKTESAILGYERAVEVVDVLCVLAMG